MSGLKPPRGVAVVVCSDNLNRSISLANIPFVTTNSSTYAVASSARPAFASSGSRGFPYYLALMTIFMKKYFSSIGIKSTGRHPLTVSNVSDIWNILVHVTVSTVSEMDFLYCIYYFVYRLFFIFYFILYVDVYKMIPG